MYLLLKTWISTAGIENTCISTEIYHNSCLCLREMISKHFLYYCFCYFYRKNEWKWNGFLKTISVSAARMLRLYWVIHSEYKWKYNTHIHKQTLTHRFLKCPMQWNIQPRDWIGCWGKLWKNIYNASDTLRQLAEKHKILCMVHLDENNFFFFLNPIITSMRGMNLFSLLQHFSKTLLHD